MHERQAAERRGQALLIETATGIVVAVLIAVTWMFTLAFTHADEREAENRLAANLSNMSQSLQWQLVSVERHSETDIEHAAMDWQRNRAEFNAEMWADEHPSSDDPSRLLLQLDVNGRVRTANRPELVGRDFSRDRIFADFARTMRPHGADRSIGIGSNPGEIVLGRPLTWPDGSPAGTLLLAFDPWRGMQNLPALDFGKSGVVALLRHDGGTRFLIPSNAVGKIDRAQTLSLFDAALKSPSGSWTGLPLDDGIEREVYYSRLPDLDMLLLVGVGRQEVLDLTLNRSEAVLIFAAVVSVMLALGAILAIRQIDISRKREERLAADRNLIESAYGELAQAKANSERKSAEIEATLAGVTDGVMMLDAELRLVNWNDRFAERIGIPRQMLRVGMSVEDLVRYQAINGEFGEVNVEYEVLRRMAAMRGLRGASTVERIRPDGSAIELRRSRLPDGGLVTLYIDVSARKQAEESVRKAAQIAEEAAEQKSRFVAIVSHEIRTPLNAVINCLGLLDESELSTAQRRLANTAREAGEALMELVNDILELSNAEAGKLQLRPSVFELTPLLEGVRAMFQPAATKRGIRISLDIATNLPRQIRADPGRLRQVVMNLVSNAAKFSSPGPVNVQVKMVPGEDTQPMLQVSVQDHGPAIPPDDAAKLFVPFSRLSNARSAGTPGTGLGLAICERLTRVMGGQLGLRSAPSGGNEFWFTLPLEAAAAALPNRALTPGSAVSLLQRPRARILIVEDIPANHLVAATLLRREGFRVDVAESGPAGIALVQRMPYDLVFMDLIMPDMDGLEATRRIRALPDIAARLPIVALTATTSTEDRTRCIAAGMDDMLGKPIRPAALFELVQSYLGSPNRLVRTAEPPPPPPGDTGRVIDEQRLQELRHGLAPATVISLVEQCLDDIRDRLPTLRTALSGGEPKAIEMAAHALSGMSASYGFAALDVRMRRIIRHARAGEIDAAREAGEGADGDFAVAAETIRLHLREAVA